MRSFFVLLFLLAIIPITIADQPKLFDPSTIKDKVRLKPNDEFVVEFTRNGDQLTKPSLSKTAKNIELSINVKLALTEASPEPPPRKDALRPYLAIENNFDKSLHFRVLVRMKGSKEFVELIEDVNPIPAGESFNKCWGFETHIEEVVIYEFKLSDKLGE